MKLKILKGTDEIGGSCVEIQSKNTKILIDYGTPLKEGSKEINLAKNINAVLLSHPHQDHFGEIFKLESNTPIFCGKTTKELITTTNIFTNKPLPKNNFQIFNAWESFKIGEFKITPYLVDHSAVDAYSFLIEAENKKILYSGDFRASGRKSVLFDKMIKDKNIKNVDILLLEGTMIQRSNDEFIDEKSVEDKIYEVLSKNSNLSFLISSSQNIDRIVSAYRANKKANKIFVVDIYTAWVLEVIKENISTNIPNISWNDIKVIKNFGGSYYEKLKEYKEYFGKFSLDVFRDIVSLDEIKQNLSKYFIKISQVFIQKLLEEIELKKANIIYSQWLGYLNEKYSSEKNVKLLNKLKDNYNWIYVHTSGHANLETLKTYTKELNPKKIVPIHTEYKQKFEEYFENVMILEDNEVFDLETDNLSSYQVKKLNELFKDDFLDE